MGPPDLLIQMIASTNRLQSASFPTYKPGWLPRNSNTLDHRSGDSVMFDIYSV